MPDVRAPERRREQRRTVTEPGAETNREELAGTARFTEWRPATADALAWEGPDFRHPADVLREALAEGPLGHPWDHGFPRYAWHRTGDVVHEFRLTGESPGHYTGYTLHSSEWPEGIA
ncbi:hypothetical protein OG217_05210 [Streptomyces sp. NBC_01023]|uniref:hypothetical protein n=1 Tax=Streptomyces sp. NBC_01023 TaxID=2903724 RepID=UPI00386C84DC|nr:hypothetical protein OG217_05210 [Streptomyces sp. NBC_01023]